MKRIPRAIAIVFILLSCCLTLSAQAQNTRISVSAKADNPQISRHIYGHFAEHLGRCIYGGFYVGEDSPIPNSAGVRNDIIAALKDLEIPNLRWPGGCFADTYHWKDGVGPKTERPTIVNTWWGGVTEDNSFGTHEFLNLCEMLETEPYVSGNVGSGTVQELADWVQYTNFDGVSPMSDLRRANGREKPWSVRYWGIGNEAWGCGGNMRPEHYVDVYRKYATFMSNAGVEGGIYKIASGASDADYHWTEVLMRDIPHRMLQAVALHHYSVIDWSNKSSSTDFTEGQYFKTMQKSWLMDELIRKHSDIMDKYDPDGKVDLIVDEWGGWYDVMPDTNPGFLFQQNTMRDAMVAGMVLNVFNNHARRVKMANLAQTVNVLQAVILTDEEKMLLTPTYHVMHMYKVHQDAQLLDVAFDSPVYRQDGEELPALSVSASRNAQGQVNVSLVNIDASQAHKITLDLSGLEVSGLEGRILTSKSLQDHNTFDAPERIKPVPFKAFSLRKGEVSLELPPFSVLVLSEKS
ncbi:alpha-L-arabinofuranosidase C-terminal domain-containing protein [Robiginitalea sp. M366]|uniref:alpha-N-arabinofuranosidase n=1 Tax=Robiginitalea aestuariiviva TaxID=3036903 RepID=UPI00240E18F8|nr:alpha-L-arabinofuranosidase C-terminal domain-containing protein [Robiginitalea aestuariiviva]MDG1572017.1 alpha-L-arabinofuranosidase C-terminal domain-containing protein [Robiginitalea aestuariiviva]